MSEDSSPQPREIAEQRGDFMLLPPLVPTFGRPARLQQAPADYLVTRRPTAVTTAGLAHALDHELLGRVKGRARRARGRRRSAAGDLDHLITPPETEPSDETREDSSTVPAAPTPRVLRSAPTSTRLLRTVPASMPSRVDVRRAVSAPAASSTGSSSSAPEPPIDVDAALAELPPSTFPSVGQSSPVVRRRRGVEPLVPQTIEAASEAPERMNETPTADVVIPADGDEPPAIRRRQPRGRVHQPPEDLLASVPVEQSSLSSASRTQDLRSSSDVIESSPGASGERSTISDLVHRPQGEEPTSAAESTPRASATPAASHAPSASPAANADAPMRRGSEPAMPPAPSSAPPSPGSTGIQRRARNDAGSSATSAPSTPSATSSSAPEVAPPSGKSSQETSAEMLGGAVSGESRPLLADGPSVSPVTPGSSGIQRRARDDAGSSAPSEPSTPSTTSSSAPEVAPPSAPSVPPMASTALTPPDPGGASISGEASGGAGAGAGAASGESRPLPSDGPSSSPVAPGSTGIQRRARDRSEPSVASPSVTSPSAPDVPADSALPGLPAVAASRPLIADVPPIASPEPSPVQRRSLEEADARTSTAAEEPNAAVQVSPTRTPLIGRNETPVAPGSPGSKPEPTEAAMGVASSASQPPATSQSRTRGQTSSNASRANTTPVAGSISRPTLASSGRTGIQRRERSRPAGGDASPGGLANLGSMPEPRVQGPRRLAVPEPVRQILRETVGEPPAHVTVHEGGTAAQMTDSVNAEAFTRDGQIYFAGDAPVDSPRGQQLLAHELTHVIQQQGRAGSMPGEHTDEGQDLERAARQVEDHMVNGRGRSARAVVRAPKAEGEEPTPLHHRIGSMDAPSMKAGGAGAVTSSGSQAITQTSGNSISSSSAHGVDAGVQRKAREPSRGILDGIGDTASKAWSKSRESLLGQLEQEFSGPPKSNKEPDSRAKQLERQAADLYPYLRRRLRAELVRDLERRGRL